MKMTNNFSQNFKVLQEKIMKAQDENEPIDNYVKEQIDLLQGAHDEFVKKAAREGFDIDTNDMVAETRIKQYSAMKQLAMKIGMPADEYDKAMNDIRTKVLGEEITKKYFGD